jgi:hypothetical protein
VTITSRVGKVVSVECCSYARWMDVIGQWRGRLSCKGVASRRRSQGIIGESPIRAWQTASGRWVMAVSWSWWFVVIAGRQRWRWEDDGVGQEMETCASNFEAGASRRGEAVVAAAWLSRSIGVCWGEETIIVRDKLK